MAARRDYGEVLEVGRNASPDELRRACRRLARHFHPDVAKDRGSVSQATLGARITLPTVEGDEAVTITAGTQPGRVLRRKGKGIPRLPRGERSDQLVVISVAIPPDLTAELRELFENLGATMGNVVVPQESGFLDRLEDLLGGPAE